MNKKNLTEHDIRTKFITPALDQDKGGAWDIQTQLLEEHYFTAGRVIVRGKTVKRGKAKKVDYLLFYKPNIPIALIEAKDNNHSVGDGMQQALEYAELLDIPFVYSSNGDAFLEHDRTEGADPVEREIPLDQFPSPEELWQRYRTSKGYNDEQSSVATFDFYDDGSGKKPRYYQLNAINRTVDAIARGVDRILLVMATGTGKTYTAFQIIWRLWKSGAKKRILFLVDRNILANQTMVGDFKPFKGHMVKLTSRNSSIEKSDGTAVNLPTGVSQDRKVDKSYEIYLCLYQAVTGTEEEQNIYKQFSPDFFDLIVIDECHRGSAAEDASWRQVLTYFSSATQIGLTATPKENTEVDDDGNVTIPEPEFNYKYFGNPIYTYSLKQGIDDGFLAPYKVIRVGLDKDLDGWRPEAGKLDRDGKEIEDREYNLKDYDKNLVLKQRTEAVAAKITEFLHSHNRFAKTIVFCENIDHAERMRSALVNANPDLAAANSKYVMRITGDNNEGKAQLDNFIDPESTYPVIATTSRLMTTGVDAKTCHLIVLDRSIKSMTEFKQIIGRGTRIDEDYGKLYFTIIDFRKATSLFADPEFDGEAEDIYEPGEDDPIVPGDEPIIIDGEIPDEDEEEEEIELPPRPPVGPSGDDIPPGEGREKYYVDDVEVTVAIERVQYLDSKGDLITESLTDYTRKSIQKNYATLDDFLTAWNTAERKATLIKELAEQGIFFEELAEQVGHDYGPFDLICHIAYDQPPLTRQERANKVQKRDVFSKYGEQARAVLEALLDKYANSGIQSVESLEILKLDPLRQFGTPIEIIQRFGSKKAYLKAIQDLESALYAA